MNVTLPSGPADLPGGGGLSASTVLSVNVGMPKDVSWQGKTVHTGVWKHPVEGLRMVRRLNIDGDGQGDLNGHGGEQRAVLVYQIQSYWHWQEQLGRQDFVFGQFGENLTVDGLADGEVCIGDRFSIGEAEFEVTQPRVTCYRVGLRLGEPQLPALMVGHHRPGFYMRVIREGRIQAGDRIIKTAAGRPALTVAEVDALLYLPDRNPAQLRQVLRIPALSPGWQQSFTEMVADEATPAVPAGSRMSTDPAWTGFRPLRVVKVVPETGSVSSIYLADPEGGPLPPARAGQYVTVRVAGAGTPAPVRSYSLSSAAGTGEYRISVKQDPRGIASPYIVRELRPGMVVDVAAPRGTFVLDEAATPLLLVSAGIGITPVLSMLHQLVAEHSHRDIWWIHGTRGPQDYAFGAEAGGLLSSLPNSHRHLFFSAATEEECLAAHAISGRITQAALSRLGIPAGASAYLCGPDSFMADAEVALTSNGIDPNRIRTERFGALPSITPGIKSQSGQHPHQPEGPPGTGPLVTFARSGISTRFRADTASVLELAEACAVDTRWSCRTGVCHTCITPLVSGSITYRPAPLEPPAEGDVLICCAHPDDDIVLEL